MATRPIGFHASLEGMISFLPSAPSKPDVLMAEVSNANSHASVVLPEIQLQGSEGFSSLDVKVQRLLRNRHLSPVYSSQFNEVCFQPISPMGKTWEKGEELPLPKDAILTYRSNGTISYAIDNKVTTWNWVRGTKKETFYEATQITALGEQADGSLVVGDVRGQIHLGGQEVFSIGKMFFNEEKKITKIISTHPSHLLIQFEGNYGVIFDYKSKEGVCDLGIQSQIEVLGNGAVATVNSLEKELSIYRYFPGMGTYLKIKKDKNVTQIDLASDTKLLILYADEESFALWDSQSEAETHFKDPTFFKMGDKGKMIWVGDKTFAIRVLRNRQVHGARPEILFFENQKTRRTSVGAWFIDDMILLSDGSIMCATNRTPSGIHIVTKEGNIGFSSGKELTDNKNVIRLTELVDGSVAVEFNDSILILNPKVKESEDLNYTIEKRNVELKHKIETLEMELRYNPHRLDLYLELASLYSTDSEKQYQVYRSGIEASLKFTNIYQARLFYEKARQIKPMDAELCRFFLSYLQRSPYKKLEMQVRLELLALTKEETPSDLKERKHKERLLIGEGDFSYTEALLSKHAMTHPELSKSITATELEQLLMDKGVEERVQRLTAKGVSIDFGIDAQSIDEKFKGRRFKRIQWNCPFGDADSTSRELFKKVIPNFFRSGSDLQLVGDRIHVTLVQVKNDKVWKAIRQIENPIVLGATSAGYRLIRKRRFGTERYPGYRHVKTKTTKLFDAPGEEREFVFEKTDLKGGDTLEDALALKNPREKEYEVKADKEGAKLEDCYFECSTDDDSSDYYDSDEEKPIS